MKNIIMMLVNLFKNIGKVLVTPFAVIFWGLMMIANSLVTPYIIMRWALAGSSIRNNECNGMFHRVYFHTTYYGQKLFNKIWK